MNVISLYRVYIKMCKKPIDNISRGWYTKNVQKMCKNCIDNISPLERIYPHDFYLFENVQKNILII